MNNKTITQKQQQRKNITTILLFILIIVSILYIRNKNKETKHETNETIMEYEQQIREQQKYIDNLEKTIERQGMKDALEEMTMEEIDELLERTKEYGRKYRGED